MDCTIFLSALLLLNTVNISNGVCSNGWFGSSCQYKCHCVNNQCDVDGKCTGGSTCDRGWFGPLCQYQDLTTVQLSITTSNNKVTDGDDLTCDNVQTVTVSWDVAYQVMWLRVVMSEPDSLQNVQVLFKNNSGTNIACTDQTLVRVYTKVTDIFCSNNILAQQVFVDFKSNKIVCSVYISGGRNLALRQPTWQSSNYTENGVTFDSTRAVDGNPSSNYLIDKSCTHTNSGSSGSWMVNFTQAVYIDRYVLYNRDNNRDRLKGFTLTSYSSTNKKLFTYKDTKTDGNVPVYNVTTATGSEPVSYVVVNVTGILTLCEVETYGDYICTSRKYGLECAKTCNCNDPTETCFVATGGCRSGCAAGYQGEGCLEECDITYYGLNCAQSCSSNCRDQLCNNVNGTCYNCYIGKQGALCDQDCNATFYGQNCTQRCSTNCTNQLCNNVDGTCNSCVPGKQGRFCDLSCEGTYYGQNCAQRCGITCAHQLCNIIDGTCNSCVPGKQGSYCDQDCDAKHYGENCSNICNTNCTNQLCNNINGVCNSCVPGKKGNFCDQDCNATYYGLNCSQRCSTNCTNQLCDRASGNCSTCIYGNSGPKCDLKCDVHHYGENCLYNCSTNCIDSVCDSFTGECSSCVRGFQGPHCEKLSETKEDYSKGMKDGIGIGIGIGIGTMCGVFIISIAVICLVWRLKRTKHSNGDAKNNYANQVLELGDGLTSPAFNSENENTKVYDYINESPDTTLREATNEASIKSNTYNSLKNEYNDESNYMSIASTK
ncbi:multiple epidermal growth factor-like domains protein 11 [Physella acuta]|uniref:multiple epidermal growth factor-like domains protein 11 n=1 Tax=Physella acuta TaxID=109671 RepID=UPI0027DE9E60|nr:multiple epidermal growth factor-like domains protein 11 [Physella acuta]